MRIKFKKEKRPLKVRGEDGLYFCAGQGSRAHTWERSHWVQILVLFGSTFHCFGRQTRQPTWSVLASSWFPLSPRTTPVLGPQSFVILTKERTKSIPGFIFLKNVVKTKPCYTSQWIPQSLKAKYTGLCP